MTCTHCGASTPLPDDVRVPTFQCQYCRAELETVAYAGLGAVRAEAMKAALDDAARGVAPTERPQQLVHGTAGTRGMPCAHCGAALAVPLDVTVPRVTCAACGRVEPVSRYISDAERLAVDMQRQQEGNAAMAALLANGVTCERCGAPNPVPRPIPVQVSCGSCHHAILLAGHVAADAVDRARLKESVLALREATQAQAARQERTNARAGVAVAVIMGVVFVVLVAVSLVKK